MRDNFADSALPVPDEDMSLIAGMTAASATQTTIAPISGGKMIQALLGTNSEMYWVSSK